MKISIIIGFQYGTLTGTKYDIYHAYNWCSKISDHVYILTDIDDLEFNISEFKHIIIRNGADLITNIKKILIQHQPDKVVIYYSGHGLNRSNSSTLTTNKSNNSSLVLPNSNHYSFNHFRDAILSSVDPHCELAFFFDCCNPNGLNLPYKLVNNRFKLVDDIANINFITNPILLITSANDNELSIGTDKGSLFSLALFNILNKMDNRNLGRLVNTLKEEIMKQQQLLQANYPQTVSIYSSYVTDPILWMWLENKTDIVPDLSLTCLVIR